ncbi:MAG: 1-deoxy-D-xylulose-5-phosphate synthase [Spirochaetes bacterium]|nr:1-deoxy-D-xylulose-5-phosphate synthase [Spirochaetota bacterium]
MKDLKRLGIKELEILSSEVRDLIIDVIAKNGGHLASSLGVVELTVALHYVFNTPEDRLIWDVGHQCYAHKILTGRRSEFKNIRKYGGISGFPKTNESRFDTFCVGHSSTSLSLALGSAVGRDFAKKKNRVVAIIGDGSLTGGMAFEALNHIGHLKKDLIIILNDNEHSISKNVGALSEYLTRMISGTLYNRFRSSSMEFVKRIPRFGESIFLFLTRFFESFKGMIIPGQLFEDMGIRYFGPVDGHNLGSLIDLLKNVKEINSGPRLIHVITKKGKGYLPAELNPAKFHGIGPFDRSTGIPKGNSNLASYSEIAGKTLAHIAKSDKRIVAITAAMKLGTGLYEFEKRISGRFFDVGIAEQHSITFAAALASSGMKPFVSIYSTFLQRAVDQLIHDVALMNLPVRLLIDRSGIVGDDGETHHGLFDISIIKSIPNFTILAPMNGSELRDMIYYAAGHDSGPIAIRYPRGRVGIEGFSVEEKNHFVPGMIKVMKSGTDVAILAAGDMVQTALNAASILKRKKISAAVVNLMTLKPMDIHGIEKVIRRCGNFITLENGTVTGGIGEQIASLISPELRPGLLFLGGFPDRFIQHGDNSMLFRIHGIDEESITERIASALTGGKKRR